MKLLLALASFSLVLASFPTQEKKPDVGLPQLHTIRSATLSPSYSCRPEEESRAGYAKTGLFLSGRGEPDLLFNGACGSKDEFDVEFAGDDMSLITDLGDVPLQDVTTQKAFNFKNAYPFDSKFTRSAKVVTGHTYAVLFNKSRLRGLFVFTVINHLDNTSVDLLYAVKHYQILKVQSESDGFDWTTKNQTPAGQGRRQPSLSASAGQTNH